jgi:AbiU2
MNADQKSNIDSMVLALGQSISAAWSYLHLLRGLDQGRYQNPEVLERFGLLFDRAWRSIFDGLFAKVGTVLDATKGTHSLPNLMTLIRRYGTADLKQLLPEVEASLVKEDTPLAKLRNWRHETVAHRPTGRQDSKLYADNKMTLTEIESALSQLDELFNHLSRNVLAIENDTRSGTEILVEDGKSLFTCIAVGMRGLADHKSED